MKSSASKQTAELRVVLHDNGRYFLLLDARVRGFDVYYGSGSEIGTFKFRTSWHETGKTHVYLPIGRQIGVQRVSPKDFTGKVHLATAGHGGQLSWDYRPKSDSKTRRTVIIDVTTLARKGCSAELWAVEWGNEHLVAEVVSGTGYQGKKVVGHVIADWTQPQLVAIACTLSDEAMRSLQLSIIKECTESIHVDSNDAKAYSNRGAAHLALGQHQQAIQDYDEATRLVPKLAEQLEPYYFEANLNLAIGHLEKDDHDNSIEYFNRAIKVKPDFAPAHNNRGVAYLKKGEYDTAMENLNEAIRLQPDYAYAYANRGVVHLKSIRYDGAIEDFNQAIKQKADWSLPYYNRACAHSLRKDLHGCLADLGKAIALEPARRERAKEDEDLEWARQDPRVKSLLGIEC